MLRRKSIFGLILLLGLIFLSSVALTPHLFTGRRNVNRSEDYFEMSLEELMTIDIASAVELGAGHSTDLFEMPLEDLMAIEVS